MAAIIYSENFLAACLIFAQGDVNKPFQLIIESAQKYQQLFNRHFGIAQDDFRNLIIMMFYWEKGISFADVMKDGNNSNELNPNLLLTDGIDYMLNNRETYFNDEGQSFSDSISGAHFDSEESRIARDKAFYGIRNFMVDHTLITSEGVTTFLETYPYYVFTDHGNYCYDDDGKISDEFNQLREKLHNLESDNSGLIDFLKTHPQCFYLLFRCSRRGEGS